MSNLAGQEPIAVIGMAGRFPGAADIGRYWANLRDGVGSIAFPDDAQLLAAGVPEAALTDERYVRAAASAPELDSFDAEFFGLTPREARICDPQIRVFLECAHAALEDAGHDPARSPDVGVFGSAGTGQYLDLVRRAEGVAPYARAGLSLTTWNSPDYLAPLVSYKLGLRGPSLGVVTACASSLVAVHLASASLRAGECDVALAGGADVELPLGHGYWWEPGGTLSRDGHCRPFDKDASGTVFSSGAGVVALKRLSDALADGDHVRAVLRATAVTNDGADKAGFAAPSVTGQAAAVAEAMTLAGVHPDEVGMVEAHATGTVLGDSIEVAALTSAYRYLGAAGTGGTALTSVKGSIGHLGRASGVASLIKAVLSLEHGLIPVNVGFRQPGPELRIDGSPFHLPTRALPWTPDGQRTRIAAVNTYGVGGTNAHAVLEQAPVPAPEPDERRPRIVVWSARTPQAADRYRERLAGHFAAGAGGRFAASVATLQQGRSPHPHRGAVVAVDAAEAAALLRAPHPAGPAAGGQPGRVVLLFPGIGVQQPGVALDLYERVPAFTRAFDECLELFEAQGVPLGRVWRSDDEAAAHEPLLAQPLVFAVEHALAAAWRSWGVEPDAVLGHSLGELAAGAAAGVFDTEDAVRVVAARARAVETTGPGGMIAVAASRAEVEAVLPEGVAVAVVNGPRQVVVSGAERLLAGAAQALADAGLRCRPVRTARASHVPLLEPAVALFEEELRKVRLAEPLLAYHSAALGRAARPGEVTDPGFWSRQLVEPVLFADALDDLVADGERRVLVEAGPGRALTAVVRQHPAVAAGRLEVLPTLAQRRTEPLADLRSALTAVAGLWTEGRSVDWAAVEDLAGAGRVPLPGYPYERERHWVDVTPADLAQAWPTAGTATAPAPAPVPVVPAQAAAPQPAPVAAGGSAVAVAAPVTTAGRLRGLWSALLGRPEIADDADFFDLGGNSLTAVELMAEVHGEFGVDLGLVTLFDHPTLDALAAQIDRRKAS